MPNLRRHRAQVGAPAVMTQVTDIELECDGFLNYDRSVKCFEAELKRVHDVHHAIH
eukprot:COSAG01_NODE_5405_length_4282_cov_3.082955_6_plen_56_part_00